MYNLFSFDVSPPVKTGTYNNSGVNRELKYSSTVVVLPVHVSSETFFYTAWLDIFAESLAKVFLLVLASVHKT